MRWKSWIHEGIPQFRSLSSSIEGAVTADLVSEPTCGTSYGVLGTVNGVGDLVASVVVGALWTPFSLVMAFAYGALMMGLGTVVMYRVR
jgi:hypothetical protein